MFVRRLELADVRSYERLRLDAGPGVTVFVGPNGQGKTNLLEAVHRAATGGSHRVASDAPLVRLGAEVGAIRIELVTDDARRRTLELEVGSGRRTRTRVDGHDVRRAADALGILRVVLFAPEDVAIVRGDPSERRRFLDELLGQRRPAFAAARSEYDRALRQRNQLLKQLRGLSPTARGSAHGTLAAWTEQLIAHGTQLVAARHAAVAALSTPVDAAYAQLADHSERVSLTYRCSAGELGERPAAAEVAAALRAALEQVAADEVARGVSLVGPHRDELDLGIGQLPARGYASHGEVWSLALALKLASYELLAEVGDRPVVLLDDVFAELDAMRRAALATACDRFEQVLVTAAVDADVPLDGGRIEVTLEHGLSRLTPRTARHGHDPQAGVA